MGPFIPLASLDGCFEVYRATKSWSEEVFLVPHALTEPLAPLECSHQNQSRPPLTLGQIWLPTPRDANWYSSSADTRGPDLDLSFKSHGW
ncbi:hypothetical protein CEXT_541261 [Caerostris extrusa]|uniref:Uncharacterized protein n=1 Tax=Caerostris extrusa TaxID=172846 RepID=A0AAV4YE51_CAEEX|nr:hypothetical protein CEXT_541261 [Caerostris extrusa]